MRQRERAKQFIILFSLFTTSNPSGSAISLPAPSASSVALQPPASSHPELSNTLATRVSVSFGSAISPSTAALRLFSSCHRYLSIPPPIFVSRLPTANSIDFLSIPIAFAYVPLSHLATVSLPSREAHIIPCLRDVTYAGRRLKN